MVGSLLRVDGQRRVDDVDFLGEFLRVVEGDGELAGAGVECLAALIELEALALGADGVISLAR